MKALCCVFVISTTSRDLYIAQKVAFKSVICGADALKKKKNPGYIRSQELAPRDAHHKR